MTDTLTQAIYLCTLLGRVPLCPCCLWCLPQQFRRFFIQSMGADDRSKGEEFRMEKILAEAVTVDGRQEWYCRYCSETNVWTRSKCRRCQTKIPAALQRGGVARTRLRWDSAKTSFWVKRPRASYFNFRRKSRKWKRKYLRCSLKERVKKASPKNLGRWWWVKRLTARRS